MIGPHTGPFFMELKPIPIAPGYSASKCGHIISHRRFEPHTLKPLRHNGGYTGVSIRVGDRFKRFLVHRLVMLAWMGPCPKGWVVNHLNGDKTDNRLANLEYCTYSMNMAHACATGLSPKPPTRIGEYAPKAKLTAQQVILLRKETDREPGYLARLSAKYGVTTPTISKALLGQTWRHLPLDP